MVLRRCNGMRGLSSARQRGEGQRLVAMALLNAEESDRPIGEQLVYGSLNVGAHVAGELPRCRDQPIVRSAGEVPIDGRAGKVEPLCFRDRAQFLCRGQHTVLANQRRLLDQAEWCYGKIAAELAAIAVHAVTGLGRHRQVMAGFANALLRRVKQRFGHCARIRAAHRLAFLFDADHHLEGVGRREAEYRTEQTGHKNLRGVVIVMKHEPNVARLNAVHRKLHQVNGNSLPDLMEQIKNNFMTIAEVVRKSR